MAFKKMEMGAYPPRLWALVGYPGSGKSTFTAQMDTPILAIDADHRFSEVAHLAGGDVLQLSDIAADNGDAERVAALLRANMPGAGVRTIVVDSLTSIIAPLVSAAVLDNDAGRNRNRMAAFKAKALALRLLQDEITRWGSDTLWVYHLRSGLDAQAQAREVASISAVELARLRRCLNLELRLVEDDGRRGVTVTWARRGRAGLTLWDETGCWRGMPGRIETAVYGGLSQGEQDALERRTPASFTGPEAAIAWGWEAGAFRDAVHAKNAYEKLKRERTPATAGEMWRLWAEDVARRLEEGEK